MRALRATWAVVWRALALLCLWGGALAGPIVWLDRHGGAPGEASDPRRLAFECFAAAALLASTLVLVRLVDRLPLSSVGVAVARLPGDVAAGAAGAVVWLGAALAAIAATGSASIDPAGTFSWRALAVAAASIAANAFLQELLFRGYLFQLVLRAAGPVAAVAVTSALFCAAHLPAFRGAWLPALDVALAGALFAVALLRTGALWLPLGLHAGWNVLVGPVLGLDVSGRADLGAGWRVLALHGPDAVSGGAFGIEGSVATTAATAAAIFFVAGWRRNRGAGRPVSAGRVEPPPAA